VFGEKQGTKYAREVKVVKRRGELQRRRAQFILEVKDSIVVGSEEKKLGTFISEADGASGEE